MKALFELEIVGGPDDGMITVETGCSSGNGVKSVAAISEDLFIEKLAEDCLVHLKYEEWAAVIGHMEFSAARYRESTGEPGAGIIRLIKKITIQIESAGLSCAVLEEKHSH